MKSKMHSSHLSPGDMAGLILVVVLIAVIAGTFAAIVWLLGIKVAIAFFVGLLISGLLIVRIRR